MIINIKTVTNKFNVKLISLALGYIVWSTFCYKQEVEIKVGVPVCFYDLDDTYTIDCCEKITVSLKASRKDLAKIDYDYLAVHIDGSQLNEGPNYIYPSSKNIFLSPAIQITHIVPNNLIASLTKKSK